MKKLILALLFISTAALAQKVILLEVVSENILKVEHNGEVKRVHLAGIELFSKANININSKRTESAIDFDKRETFKKELLTYIQKQLVVGKEISYLLITKNGHGVEKVWIENSELNYKMVRDGYALVDLNDADLPTAFQMRMTIAMRYAKEKKIGLWEDRAMLALINDHQHMCGWPSDKLYTGLTREDLLKEQQESLPNSARVFTKVEVAQLTQK